MTKALRDSTIFGKVAHSVTSPRALIAVCSLILAVQVLVVGAPTGVSKEILDSASLRILTISPQNEREMYRVMKTSSSYATSVAFGTSLTRDGIVSIVENANDDWYPSPAQMIFVHGPSHRVAPMGYRRVNFPVMRGDSADNWDYLFGSPQAMAVGDFNPPLSREGTGLSEDLVIGFNNRDSTLAIVNDFDARAFTESPALIPASNLKAVQFNCTVGRSYCRESQVNAIATGNFNSDSLLDIAIVASNTMPAGANEEEYPMGTYLFVCLQRSAAAFTFDCSSRGMLAPGTIGSFDTERCDLEHDPKCLAGQRYPFGQSFTYGRSGARAGYFIAAFTEGSWVHVAEFKGTAPLGRGENATVRSHNYQIDYPNYPVAAQSAQIVNLIGGPSSPVDLAVQIQPDIAQMDLTYGPRGFQGIDISQNVVGWPASWPIGRVQMPIASRTQFWKAIPMLVGDFGMLADSAGKDGLEAMVAGVVAQTSAPYDFTSTRLALGGELNPMYFQLPLASGIADIRQSVSGEFALSTNYLDKGKTAMRPDVAVLTDVNPDTGMRHIFFVPNRVPTQ